MTKPTYLLIAAVTIDGKIARQEKPGTSWTSPEDKAFLHKKLDSCDCLVVGHTTYQTATNKLAQRNCIVFTHSTSGGNRHERCRYLNPQRVNLDAFVRSRGYRTVGVLGGISVFNYFLQRNLIDDLYLTIEPLVFGDGLPLADARITNRSYRLRSVRRLNASGTLLIHYQK